MKKNYWRFEAPFFGAKKFVFFSFVKKRVPKFGVSVWTDGLELPENRAKKVSGAPKKIGSRLGHILQGKKHPFFLLLDSLTPWKRFNLRFFSFTELSKTSRLRRSLLFRRSLIQYFLFHLHFWLRLTFSLVWVVFWKPESHWGKKCNLKYRCRQRRRRRRRRRSFRASLLPSTSATSN